MENSVAMAVERRRIAEEERKKRIFNTRNRVIGLDVAALESQVAERREREMMEKSQDRAFESLQNMHSALLRRQFQEEERRRVELERELVQFRATYQRAEDSRDADINFKQMKSLGFSPPDLVQDLGPASMQVFQGGDAMEKRRKAQLQELQVVLKVQTQEKAKMNLHNKQKDLLWGKAQLQQDLRALKLSAAEEECKREAQVALSKYNQAQAKEKEDQQKLDRLKEEGEKLSEVWHMMTSDLLTECPEAAEGGSGGAGPRVLLDRWKGMSEEQLSTIRKQRGEQLAEKERQRDLERQRDAAWDSLRMIQNKTGVEEETREREGERERRTEMDRYNLQLAREQHAHQQYLDKSVYTNRPAASYFTQFGSSSR
ncbi:hypothetical protein AGOR_G00132350 [Albula goreensis]|uniref:RIB43A-like with coiled-coils protein 1 n=1 Tax=Albula goreensis TaxID=1534307 RepID=A0A8T3D864_9TELE|nr:hypothetical protein AGOR_G00132350 [Albula goreensis]